jgi:hypothetical protein
VLADAAGARARARGASTAGTIDRLAVLLGIGIALIPTVPLLALYLPLRISWRRDHDAVRRAVAQWGGDPEFVAFLARRALTHLPFHELRELGYDGTEDPSSNLELAAAELRWLGLSPGGNGGIGLARERVLR